MLNGTRMISDKSCWENWISRCKRMKSDPYLTPFIKINSKQIKHTHTHTHILFFGCVGSLLLCAGFLQLWRAGATLHCSARASHCGGFSCCRAWALGVQASVVAALRLSSCGIWALEHVGLSSCGTWAHQLWCRSSRAHRLQQLQCAGSVVVAHGLGCSTACGIFLDQ